MIFGFFTLLIALLIAGVAAWFSIEGLMAIFSASALPIAIMAGSLEVGKLVVASWLYRYWHETKFLMKTYLTIAVLVLMMITSMGIFGYLSKAHLDQAAEGGNNQLQIQQIELRIDREQRKISDANVVISQLDQAVQTLMDYDRIRGRDGAIAVREGQAEERAQLNEIIDESTNRIAQYQDQLLPLRQSQMQVELKVGPLKYVAELVYGESSEDVLDKAVRLFILLLVVVFDPLAIMMVIAANQTLLRYGINLEKAGPDDDKHINRNTNTAATSEIHGNTTEPDSSEENISDHTTGVGDSGNDIHLRSKGEAGDNVGTKEPDKPSAVDDAALVIADSAAEKKRLEAELKRLKRELAKKPKQVSEKQKDDFNLEIPPAIAELEKRLQEKLNGK